MDAMSDRSGGFFSKLKNIGQSVKKKVNGFFSEEDDEDIAMNELGDLASEDEIEKEHLEGQFGSNYELSFAYHAFPDAHPRSFYFTSQLGDPFPSYHSNPDPFFPPRWTSIKGVQLPVENLTAPRIRLAPKELEARHEVLDALTKAAIAQQGARPKPKVINLQSQRLGDPFQQRALLLFLELNKTAEVFNLSDNELEDLREFPQLTMCKKLFLADNNISSVEKMPPVFPNLEELVLTNNFITGFDGINKSRFPKLRVLKAYGNPVFSHEFFAENICKAIPTLQVLDWMSAQTVRSREEAGMFGLLAVARFMR
jgi:hypothetical protein